MLPKSVFTVNGKPFFPIGMQACNSSGYSLSELEDLWKACALMEVNSCAIAISWDRFEPEEGSFDRELVQDIIAEARRRRLKLILLWFGTWKNGHMKYVPQWVKRDRARFARVRTHDGCEINNLSSFSTNNLEADKRAFCEMMRAVRDAELQQAEQTVIAIQVENELGIVGRAVRDCGPAAQEMYDAPVPQALIQRLKRADPGECLAVVWANCGAKESGTWRELFGHHGDEALQAYSMAAYADSIAAAGKDIYPLPMYLNAWQDHLEFDIPGIDYPSGGPVSKNLAIWRWFTPHLDMICPDIYVQPKSAYDAVAEAYARSDNPLYIPETGAGVSAAMGVFRAIANYGLTGVHFFGAEKAIREDGTLSPAAIPAMENFQVLKAVAPLLMKRRGSGRIHSIEEEEFARSQLMEFDGWKGVVHFGEQQHKGDYHHRAASASRGRGLVIQMDEDEFIICGTGFWLHLREKPAPDEYSVPQENHQRALSMNYIVVEEGYFDDDCRWHATRIRNGDETDHGIFAYPDHGAVRVVMDRRKR